MYNNRMAELEDTELVRKKVVELKKVHGGVWIPVDGFLSLVDTQFKAKDEVNFNVGKGYIAKAFINGLTGEVKLFAAALFLKDNNG